MPAYYINTDTGRIFKATCDLCVEDVLKKYPQEGGKQAEMAEKVVKIPEELYNKVKAKADADGTSMAKALDALAEGEPLQDDVEAFIPSCALEQGVKMPKDYRWIKPLAEVLPPGLRGKLEPYAQVIECAEAKAALKKAAEEHLEEVKAAETTEAEVASPEVAEQSEPVAEPETSEATEPTEPETSEEEE